MFKLLFFLFSYYNVCFLFFYLLWLMFDYSRFTPCSSRSPKPTLVFDLCFSKAHMLSKFQWKIWGYHHYLEALTCWEMLQCCLKKWLVHPYLQHSLVNLVIVVMLFWWEWGVHQIGGKLEVLPQWMCWFEYLLDSSDVLILVVCYLTWPTHPITKLVI